MVYKQGQKSLTICPVIGPMQMVLRVSLKINERLPPPGPLQMLYKQGQVGNEIDEQKLTTDRPLQGLYGGSTLDGPIYKIKTSPQPPSENQMRSQTSIALRNACYRMTQTSATHGGPMPGASEDQARLVRGPSGPVHGPGGPY